MISEIMLAACSSLDIYSFVVCALGSADSKIRRAVLGTDVSNRGCVVIFVKLVIKGAIFSNDSRKTRGFRLYHQASSAKKTTSR